jgi:hypothetical protein
MRLPLQENYHLKIISSIANLTGKSSKRNLYNCKDWRNHTSWLQNSLKEMEWRFLSWSRTSKEIEICSDGEEYICFDLLLWFKLCKLKKRLNLKTSIQEARKFHRCFPGFVFCKWYWICIWTWAQGKIAINEFRHLFSLELTIVYETKIKRKEGVARRNLFKNSHLKQGHRFISLPIYQVMKCRLWWFHISVKDPNVNVSPLIINK